MSIRGLTWLFPALFLSGCLYIAPIEEEPAPENTLPYITVVSPGPGVVEVELGSKSGLQVMLSGYGDANEGQTLYHRLVMDFRPTGVTANAVQGTVPRSQDADNRDPISYTVKPCSYQGQYPGAIADGRTIDLYFLLADDVFLHQTERFQSADFSQPFETQNGRGAVWVQWTLLFRGECPSAE